MKTRFVKAAVWMLVVSLLAVAVSFTVAAADTPVSEFTANWSLSASAQTVNLDGVNSQTVTVSLVTNKTGVYCDGIAGRWDTQTASGKITMSNTGLVINESIVKTGNTDEALNTPNYAYPITGEFMWVNSILAPEGNFGANFAIVTATYVIDPKTPTGTYVINFTKTVYAGAADVSETEETLSIAIQVNGHTCTPSEWMSDATKHWKECTVCEKELTEFTMDHIGGTANCQSGAICTGCGHAYTDKDLTKHTAVTYVIGETTHWQKCTACGTEKIDGSEHAHEYILVNNQCICGAVHLHTVATYTDNNDGETHIEKCACGVVINATAAHDFTNGDCACGAVKPVTNVTVVAKGAITHTVEGQVVTVTHTAACKVGYLQDGKYVAITATHVEGNTYTFTAPEGVTEVLLVVKGDVTGDGRINVQDKTQVNAAAFRQLTLSAIATFAGDVTGDGRINVQDKTQVNAAAFRQLNFTW